MIQNRKIIVAPLDWGLGHATRCIPIIKRLQKDGHEIIIAASKAPKALLLKEFPEIYFTELPGYNITYTKHKRLLAIKILWQIPKIYFSVKKEKKVLEKLIIDHKIDFVISDNRFGFFSKQVPSVFITHQLLIKAPYKWLEKIIRKINYSYINKFAECWVPDYEGTTNIAGELSHPSVLPTIPVKYIGSLSRFDEGIKEDIKYSAIIILSGPEPQRSLLEEKMINSFQKYTNEKFLLVRGRPDINETFSLNNNITVVNHLDTKHMQQAIAESEFVISRCGYTTVMEMLSLKKKTILIPTHGQTEQEYLATHLMQQQWAFCCKQDDDFETQFELAKNFIYTLPSFHNSLLEEIITKSIDRLILKD